MYKKIILSLITISLFSINAMAQNKNSRRQMIGRKRVVNASTSTTQIQPQTEQNQTQPIQQTTQTQQTLPPTASMQSMKLEIDELTANNKILQNSLTEKQTQFEELNNQISELEEQLNALELQQNKSKNTCKQISLKKFEDLKGWLIGSVASSSVGTAANITATTTTFLQKDENQLNKSNEKKQEKYQEKLEENPDLLQPELKNWDEQEKTNDTLQTISQISSIVGTVGSAATTITSTVATSIVSSLIKQINNCKGTF